jgi:hypothetical protein
VDTDFVSEGRGSEGNNSGNSQSVDRYGGNSSFCRMFPVVLPAACTSHASSRHGVLSETHKKLDTAVSSKPKQGPSASRGRLGRARVLRRRQDVTSEGLLLAALSKARIGTRGS